MEKCAVPCRHRHSRVKITLPILDVRADIGYRWPMLIPQRIPKQPNYKCVCSRRTSRVCVLRGSNIFFALTTTGSQDGCEAYTLNCVFDRTRYTFFYLCLPHFTHW